MLIVLESTQSNSQVLLLKINVSSFCKCKSSSHFFSAKIYAVFNDQRFNNTLTNGIVSFEQLAPRSLKKSIGAPTNGEVPDRLSVQYSSTERPDTSINLLLENDGPFQLGDAHSVFP